MKKILFGLSLIALLLVGCDSDSTTIENSSTEPTTIVPTTTEQTSLVPSSSVESTFADISNIGIDATNEKYYKLLTCSKCEDFIGEYEYFNVLNFAGMYSPFDEEVYKVISEYYAISE